MNTTPLPFHGVKTFLKADTKSKGWWALFNVLGLPVDCGTTNRGGARHGPEAIRRASAMLTDGVHPIYLINPVDEIVDHGDVPLQNNNLERITDHIQQVVGTLVRKSNSHDFYYGPHIIGLGGDHSVTLGILRALHEIHGPINIVHIDAHSDCSPSNFGDAIGHGTWAKLAIEEGLVDPNMMYSIGVRAPTSISGNTFLKDHGGTTVYGHDAVFMDPDALALQISLAMDQKPTYFTFDVDGLDPAFAPGTGTPEVGGLSTAWVLRLLRGLETLNWVGMDAVEVSPAYDHSEITALAAATVIHTYMSMNLKKLRKP
jgi:agmatinase